jgi:glycosyltransferase involved in cell wall biosynthesis
MHRLKVLLLCRYGPMAASTRHRCFQYLPFLAEHGFDVQVETLLDDDYLQRLYTRRGLSRTDIARSYLNRLWMLLRSRRFDLIWTYVEALPWIPGWIELPLLSSRVPYVVDYDDAVFHRYDRHQSSAIRLLLGRKIDQVMREAAVVVAGNQYIATRAREAGAKRVEILPTVVDLDRYPVAPTIANDTFTVGWIGSPVTAYNLHLVRPALEVFCERRNAHFVAVGSGSLDLGNVPLVAKPWSESTEVEEIQRFDVGIMPLADLPFERGKNGFKLIQYMACSRPVIASPVGVNREIVTHGENGFLAMTTNEWIEALEAVEHDQGLRRVQGEAGRRLVEEHYSLRVTAPKLANLLRSVI